MRFLKIFDTLFGMTPKLPERGFIIKKGTKIKSCLSTEPYTYVNRIIFPYRYVYYLVIILILSIITTLLIIN
ncbi:hypothetical protein DID77_01340 [Candidatus Marinamargulisbacteria bacterium SCGC AG-439-L15]|nr:hypothetical protein DID77_01340 [Candidatus Marinamargulisbacteria bacterium SCGC AG-439-L15]